MNLFRNQKHSPLLTLVAIFQFCMAILVLLHFSEVKNNIFWISFHAIVIAFLWWDKNEKLNNFKLWSVIILVPINFSELHYLVHTVHPKDYDDLLIKIDYTIFGVHPTVWLEKYTWPFLTEILQMVYTTFYFIPIALAVLLAKREDELGFFVFNIIFCFYLSYLGYFLVPAIGPRFTLDHLQSFPLAGVWIMQDIQVVLNKLENIQRDAFPSGHTAITVLTLIYAFKYNKKYAYFLLPIAIMLVISTVYLRYHYVIDVIAGLLLVLIAFFTGPVLFRYMKKMEKTA